MNQTCQTCCHTLERFLLRLLHPPVTPLRNVTKRVPMTDAIVVDVADEDCQEHNVLERFSGVWNLGHTPRRRVRTL